MLDFSMEFDADKDRGEGFPRTAANREHPGEAMPRGASPRAAAGPKEPAPAAKNRRSSAPDEHDLDLLQAALAEDAEAAAAWRRWRARGGDLEASEAGKILPLVASNLAAADIAAADRAALAARRRRAWLENRRLVAAVGPALASLSARGIEGLLLKGAALASAVHGPGERPLGDVDLLVRPERLADALEALRAAGWTELLPRGESAAPHLHSHGFAREGAALDLHGFALEGHGGEGADEGFWQRRVTARLGGGATWRLGDADLLLHVCLHGQQWSAPPALHWIADAVLVLRRRGAEIDWAAFVEEARRRRVRVAARRALEILKRFDGAAIPRRVLDELGSVFALAERFEVAVRSRPPSLTGGLYLHWRNFGRERADRAWPRRAAAFSGYLRELWGLESTGGLPLAAWRKRATRRAGAAPEWRPDAVEPPPVLGYLGVAWQVEPFARETVAALAARLPPLALAPPEATPRRRYRIAPLAGGGWEASWRDGGTGLRATFEEAIEALAQDVERLVANHADGLLLLHAGAVVWKGRALLLPGRSHSGKSRLVAALVRAGADYLSDEFAVLDGQGGVHPWPRRLALRRDDGGVDRPTAQEIGGRTASGSAPAAGVVILQYRPGAALRLESLSPATGILALLGHAVAARRRLAMVRANLSTLARQAPIAESARGEADETAAGLLEWLESVGSD